jgi:transposase
MVLLVVDEGFTFEAAAAASNVAKSTVWEWVRRWRRASVRERRSLACLEDRSSRPHSSPKMLDAVEQERICAERRRTGWGPRLIAAAVGHPHSTVHATLRRNGCSRQPSAPREAVVRFECPCPGDLLQMDTKRFARFSSPGHAVTGDRDRSVKGAKTLIQPPFGLSVQPARCTRLVPISMKNNTYSLAPRTVSTVEKSQAIRLAAWARTKLRQLSGARPPAGPRPAWRISARTVVAETLKPRPATSPAIRR